jgi:hypothetical protein
MMQPDKTTPVEGAGEAPCLSLDELLGYAENTLSQEERARVEAHLKQCEFCRRAQNSFAAYPKKQEIREALQNIDDRIRLRSLIRQIQKHNQLVRYAIAAVLLVGLSSVIYYFWQKGKPNEVIFAESFQPYPRTPLPRGEQPRGKLEEAMSQYSRKDYGGALKLFEDLLTSESEKTPIHFYTGVSYLAKNNPQRAITSFQKVLEDEGSPFKEPAEWYLGLAYLKANDLEQSKLIFNEIISQHSLYEEQAKKLLERLSTSK